MLPRFLAAIDPAGRSATLDADEAHHLTHVMRLGAGDEIAVFDGCGHEFRATVERAARDGAVLRLIEPLVPAPEPSVRLTLAQALLKSDKMDDVVRDATMMGVSSVQPVVTAHTIARHADRQQQRWRRVAIASAKQCRRAVLPDVHALVTLAELVVRDSSAVKLFLAEPATHVNARNLESLKEKRPETATLLVGPEGGWSPEETQSAIRAGWMPITLGQRTLRADAVAIVAIGVLQYVWGDL